MAKRGGVRIRVSVDDHGITSQLKKAIEAGIRASVEDIGEVAVTQAQRKIRQEGAIWKGDVLSSFEVESERLGRDVRVRIQNTARHAPYVEHGAEYTTKAPPLDALIPWVESELRGWSVVNGRLVLK